MRILVEEGKHGSWYHDASTPEALAASALAILKDRWDQGHYFYEPGPEPKWDGADRDTMLKLKEIDNDAYEAVRKKYVRHLTEYRRWKAEADEYQRVQDVLDREDGAEAWGILVDRSDHEYEYVSLEDVESHEV